MTSGNCSNIFHDKQDYNAFSYFVKNTNDFISGTINYGGNQLTPTRW